MVFPSLILCLYPVNYRGSTGFGQHSILSLIGQIGSQDVKDVQVCPFCFFCSQIQERVSATNPASDAVCQNYKNIIIFPIFDHICTCSSITYTVTPADVRKWSVLASLSFTQRAVLTVLERDPNLDPDRLAAIGGSHGGFLACHLLGQYPESYRVCAARNPVINAATLLGTSDIVDWWGRYADMHRQMRAFVLLNQIKSTSYVNAFCHPISRRYTSAGFHYSYDQIPTAEALAAMLQKSPIAHAAKVKHKHKNPMW